MLFCFPPEREPRKLRQPTPESITVSADTPSRQLKPWPAWLSYIGK
jgi:hypothetical protein